MFLGCPVWNCEGWSDVVYPAGTSRRQWLDWYSRNFNCVEGNNSFYAIPRPEHAHRWASETADGFRFCMKFPRMISHELALLGATAPLKDFLTVLEILASAQRLGPTFLQLGPDFAPDRYSILETFLRSLPPEFPWAVELRHHDWFDNAIHENRLDELLESLQIDKVLFDSRPLYQHPPEDQSERVSQTRKPKTPHRTTVTGTRPFVRIVGRNRIASLDSFVAEWAATIGDWILRGHEPYVFAHTPDDAFAPAFARMLWSQVAAVLDLELTLPKPPSKPKQLGFMFDN